MKQKLLFCPQDIIVWPIAPARWVISNVFAKTHLAVESDALELLAEFYQPQAPLKIKRKFRKNKYRAWKIQWFSHSDGLMADPTRITRDCKKWPKAVSLDAEDLIREFECLYILIPDLQKYEERFQPKTSLADYDHFGNFHQQLGQELLLNKRQSPDFWWVNQKFNKDCSGLKENLYAAVQYSYLKEYVKRKFSKDQSVIDLGCGTGFYSKLIASTGAKVLGIDPNQEYIRIAQRDCPPGVEFQVKPVGTEHGLASIPDQSADFIFMSDALLFYFVPVSQNPKFNIQFLFADIRRVLKPGGVFISMEPHYVFWLLPWLGRQTRPFTIMTEYRRRKFQVTPTLSDLIRAYTGNHFAVVNMDEVYPAEDSLKKDPRAYHFAREFPLWQIFELQPR